MDAYTSFAQVYDLFMDNVPYEQWCAFLCRILKNTELRTVRCSIWDAGLEN